MIEDATTVNKIWRNSKRPLLEEIPETSPAMSDSEKLRLQKQIWFCFKRPLLGGWPTNVPD